MTARKTLGEIARAIGGTVPPEAEKRRIAGVKTLEEAGPEDLSFFTNKKYRKQFEATRAGAVLVDERADVEPAGPVLLRSKAPYLALSKLLDLFHDTAPPTGQGVLEGAHVDPTAEIGPGSTIFPLAYVGPRARLGRAVVIYPGAYVGPGVVIGDETVVGPNAALYERVAVGARCLVLGGAVLGAPGFGFATEAPGRHRKIPQVGGVRIEDDVEIGANTTVDAGTLSPTVIGRGSKIDNLVMIAHNCKVGEGCMFAGQVGLAGSAHIGNRVTMAGQVGVAGHITVGDDVTVEAQSGITNDQAGSQLIFGSPAMPAAKARRVYATWVSLPEKYAKMRQEIESLKDRLTALEKGL